MAAVKPIPDGYYTVTPYLTVQGASQLIEFLRKAFNGTETERVMRPDGAIGHAEIIEDVSREELAKRAEAFMKQQSRG